MKKTIFVTLITVQAFLFLTLVVVPFLLLSCKEDIAVGDANDVIVWAVPKFEDRDPNEKMITFSLPEENNVNMAVELAIDSNDCLYIKMENCNMKEAARVVWLAYHWMKDHIEQDKRMLESMQDWMDAQ